MNKKIPKLSAIIITKDEQDRIKACIESLSFCDEIIVIDNNSTDKTREQSLKAGARVISYSGASFAEIRNVARESCIAEWILYIDADERVSDELKKSIRSALLDGSDTYVAYRIKRKNTYLGVEFAYVEHIIRFMRRSALLHWEGKVHETAIINGRVGDLDGYLFHDTHRTLTEMVEKTNSWSMVEARLRYEAGHPPVFWWRIIRVMITGFFDSYIYKGGWRSGKTGFIESMYQSFSMFITYAKLYELQRDNKLTVNN